MATTRKKPAAKAAAKKADPVEEQERPAPGIGEMGRQSIEAADIEPPRDPDAPGPQPVPAPVEVAAPVALEGRTSVRFEDTRTYVEIKDPKKGLEPHEAFTLYKQLGAAVMEAL